MPGQFLTISEREKLSKLPEDISADEIVTYFTLTKSYFAQLIALKFAAIKEIEFENHKLG
jgi:hypothetical protein